MPATVRSRSGLVDVLCRESDVMHICTKVAYDMDIRKISRVNST